MLYIPKDKIITEVNNGHLIFSVNGHHNQKDNYNNNFNVNDLSIHTDER